MINRYCAVLLWVLLMMPGLAFAHVPIKTLNGFYNGLLHPVFVPSQVLLLIASGLFFGQQGVRENLPAVAVFFAATVTGLVAAWFSTGIDLELIILSMAAIIGLLTAASPAAGVYGCSIIAVLAGFIVGLDSAQEYLTGRIKFLSLFGSGVGIYLLLLYPMGVANYFRGRAWQKIGIRIIGSWLAASSLMVLALSFTPRS